MASSRIQGRRKEPARDPKAAPRAKRDSGALSGPTGVFQRPSAQSRRSLEGPRGLQEWPKRAHPRHLGAMSVDFPWGLGGFWRGSSLGALRSSSDAPGGPTDFDPGPQDPKGFLRSPPTLSGTRRTATAGPRGGERPRPQRGLQRSSEGETSEGFGGLQSVRLFSCHVSPVSHVCCCCLSFMFGVVAVVILGALAKPEQTLGA